MKRLNHYQKDIAFIIILIFLQFVFSLFYPFNNPNNETIEVSRTFIFLRFDFLESGESITYIPFLAIIFMVLLVLLLIQKRRRFALIYGYAVVLVAKAYYLNELYSLSGQYTDLTVDGFLSKRVVSEQTVLAQDISLYVLLALLVVKTGIYLHDYMMHKEIIKPQKMH